MTDGTELKQQISAKQKQATLSIKLTETELQVLQIQATKAQYQDWREFAMDEFKTKIIGSKVGTPKISGPSTAKGGKVTGTTFGERW